jgi:hypothetical protein
MLYFTFYNKLQIYQNVFHNSNYGVNLRQNSRYAG